MKAENKELDIFLKNEYNIPSFQRDYVWKTSKVDDIYEEFYDAFTIDENLFLGSVYLMKGDIVDGQQRTTFLYLLTSELFISFLKQKDKMKKVIEETTNPQIKDKLSWTRKYILTNYPLMRLTNRGNSLNVYKEYPGDGETTPDNFEFTDSRKILGKQAKLIRKKNSDQDVETNMLFLWHILNKISVTVNEIEGIDNMNDVFSSLNSKGANLDTWDLLKNDIHKADEENNFTNFANLTSYVKTEDDEPKKLDKNKIHYALSVEIINKENKIPSKKQVYKMSKDLLKENGSEYTQELIELFKKTSDILSISVNDQNYKLLWLYRIIEKCKLKQIKTIFWWSYLNGHFSKNKYENIYTFYKKIIINFLIFVNINDKRGNKFEAAFKTSGFFEKVISKKYNFEEVFKNNEILETNRNTYINDLINPNSDEYAKFSTNNSYIYIGYWLSIEEADMGMALFTKCFNETANIEHVYDKSYKEVEERHLIGNKIIFSKEKNSKLPKVYSEKIVCYNNSTDGIKILDKEGSFDSLLNNTFIKGKEEFKDEWTPEDIKEKTILLIENIYSKMIDTL